MDPNRPDISQI